MALACGLHSEVAGLGRPIRDIQQTGGDNEVDTPTFGARAVHHDGNQGDRRALRRQWLRRAASRCERRERDYYGDRDDRVTSTMTTATSGIIRAIAPMSAV
jgi:hypothetical protein